MQRAGRVQGDPADRGVRPTGLTKAILLWTERQRDDSVALVRFPMKLELGFGPPEPNWHRLAINASRELANGIDYPRLESMVAGSSHQ